MQGEIESHQAHARSMGGFTRAGGYHIRAEVCSEESRSVLTIES